MVAQAIEKPGNIGALIRTSAGLGISGFILTDPLTDIYNPITIRSSLGSIFTQSIISCDSKSLLKIFIKKRINVFSAIINKNSTSYKKVKYSKSTNVESEIKKINNIDKTPPENLNKKELQNGDIKSNN